MIKLIAAIDKKRGIAKTGATPWYIKADLKHFRDLTTGGTVLMGHDTYKTIGRPLPNRNNIVASRDPNLKIPGVQVINDMGKFLKQAKDLWVIGGEQIFKSAIKYASELYLTQIDADFDCDKFFPPYEKDFVLVKNGEWQEEEGLKFKYQAYKRRQTK